MLMLHLMQMAVELTVEHFNVLVERIRTLLTARAHVLVHATTQPLGFARGSAMLDVPAMMDFFSMQMAIAFFHRPVQGQLLVERIHDSVTVLVRVLVHAAIEILGFAHSSADLDVSAMMDSFSMLTAIVFFQRPVQHAP
jgi:hypothetical protein